MRTPDNRILGDMIPSPCLSRYWLASVGLIMILSVAVSGVRADGVLTPVHLRVAGHDVVCRTPPLADNAEIYVPLDVLSSVGAQAKVKGRAETATVILGDSGRKAELAIARPQGRPMLALSDLARLLNADILRPDKADADGHPIVGPKGEQVYLLARLTGVSLQNGALHITTSFPIPYHVRMMVDVTPPRGYVDCVGAEAPDDLHPALLPVDTHGVTRLRAGQFNSDTARVVADLVAGVSLTDTDGVSGPDCTVVAAVTGHPSVAKATGIPLPLVGKSVAANTAPASAAAVVREQHSASVEATGKGTAVRPVSAIPADPHQAPPLPDDNERTVQDPDSPPDTPRTQGASSPTTPSNLAQTTPATGVRSDLPSRDGLTAPRTAGLQVHGLSMEYDSDAQVEVKIIASGRINPTFHYLDNGDLAVDVPNASVALSNPEQQDLKLSHPLLSGVTVVQSERPLIARITLHTPHIVGFTVIPDAAGVLLDLRLPRNATGALADKVIVVDAGHGGTSTGATGGGICEKDITLGMALKLRSYLEACGAKVVMTRDRDINVGLDDRPRLANAINADLFVSIHNDSNGVPNSASGTSTYYHMRDPSSHAMAQCVQQAVLAVSSLPSRGVLSDSVMYQTGFAVLRNSKMPAVLVEVAYINNHRDRLKLVDSEFQERVAKAICEGLRAYVEGRPQTASRMPESSGAAATDETRATDNLSNDR